MTNADKFKSLFGLYATELWAMPEKNFLKWLNSEVSNCSEFPNNSDTISRQDAIDEVVAWLKDRMSDKKNGKPLTDRIKDLPSAQLEQTIAEWQKDFREYINMLNIPRDDYNGIMEYIDEVPFAQQCMTATSNTMVSETVKIPVMDGTTERLPSVEPERKKGKWIGKEQYANSPEYYSWQCSVCGCVLEDPTLDKPYPFCPNCGADMKGEK